MTQWNSELRGLIHRRIKSTAELDSLLVDSSLNKLPLWPNKFYVTGALLTMPRNVLEYLVTLLGGRFEKWPSSTYNIPYHSTVLLGKSIPTHKLSVLKQRKDQLKLIDERYLIELSIENGLLPEKIKEELNLSECLLEL
jgi:BRCT domain type II-containing protein